MLSTYSTYVKVNSGQVRPDDNCVNAQRCKKETLLCTICTFDCPLVALASRSRRPVVGSNGDSGWHQDTGAETFSPDGNTFVLGVRNGNSDTSNGYIYWYDVTSGFSELGNKQIGSGASLHVEYSNNAEYVALCNRDSNVYILDPSNSFSVVHTLKEIGNDGSGFCGRRPLWLKDDKVFVHPANGITNSERVFYGYNTSDWSLLYKSNATDEAQLLASRPGGERFVIVYASNQQEVHECDVTSGSCSRQLVGGG